MQKRKTQPDISPFVYGKVPPQAIALEGCLLGSILMVNGLFDEVVHILKPETFYVDAHQRIFRAMLNLSTKGHPIDMNTVTEELKRMEDLDKVGGIHVITSLINNASYNDSVVTYARILHEKYLKREQIRICAEAISNAYEEATDAFEALDQLNGRLTDLATVGMETHGVDMTTAGVRRMKYYYEASQRPDDMVLGVPTGFPFMDKITKGWMPTYFILLAARPSVGKTALALNLARNAAADRRKPTPVYFLCMEMTEENLFDRLVSAESGILYEKITEAKLTDKELELLYEKGVQPLSTYQLKLEYCPSLNVIELQAKVRRWLSQVGGFGLVIIDYIQLMTGVREDLKSQNREQELSNISRSIKKLAGECKIPIIGLSQMSRDIEKRGDKKPQMSDLRESGALEQDADVVGFLQRDDYEQADFEVNEEDKDRAGIWFKKNRNGRLERVPMRTALEIQKWMDPDQYDMYHNNLMSFKPVIGLSKPVIGIKPNL